MKGALSSVFLKFPFLINLTNLSPLDCANGTPLMIAPQGDAVNVAGVAVPALAQGWKVWLPPKTQLTLKFKYGAMGRLIRGSINE